MLGFGFDSRWLHQFIGAWYNGIIFGSDPRDGGSIPSAPATLVKLFDAAHINSPSCEHRGNSRIISRHLSCAEDRDGSPQPKERKRIAVSKTGRVAERLKVLAWKANVA